MIKILRARYLRITTFFARALIGIGFWDIFLPWLGMKKWSERNREERYRKIAAGFKEMAVSLGGVMIKVGQFLSARLDVLPRPVTDELAGLQDEVAEETFEAISKVYRSEFGAGVEEAFEYVNPQPIAAASIGQVHEARLRVKGSEGSTPVVIKIQRPEIEGIVATDLAAVRTVARWVYYYKPLRRRVNVLMILDEFSRILYQEMDYLNEGRNAETFAEHFKEDPAIIVPKVYWEHTTRRVLTLEDVRAIKITDYAALDEAGIDKPAVARKLMNIYMKQVFEDGFFHADPHPGNLFVQPVDAEAAQAAAGEDEEPLLWKLTFVDFGMVGRVPDNLREALCEAVIAVGTRDSNRLVKSYQGLGILLPEADINVLEIATAKVFERFWGKSTNELMKLSTKEAMAFLREFEDLLYSMPFQLPQDFILMGRMLGILSGIAMGLDAEFNVWNGVAPFAQKLVAEQAGSPVRMWMNEIGNLASVYLALPRKAENLFGKLERGDLSVRSYTVEKQMAGLERQMKGVTRAIITIGLFIGGLQLYIHDYPLPGEILLGVSGLAFLSVLFARLKR